MKNADTLTRDEIRAKMQQAIKDGDNEAFYQAFDLMLQDIRNDVQQRAAEQIQQARKEGDTQILAARGVRQLTSAERDYYQKLTEAMKAKDPQQAVTNLDIVMPETIVDAVFDELQTSHPLLSRIQFTNRAGADLRLQGG